MGSIPLYVKVGSGHISGKEPVLFTIKRYLDENLPYSYVVPPLLIIATYITSVATREYNRGVSTRSYIDKRGKYVI